MHATLDGSGLAAGVTRTAEVKAGLFASGGDYPGRFMNRDEWSHDVRACTVGFRSAISPLQEFPIPQGNYLTLGAPDRNWLSAVEGLPGERLFNHPNYLSWRDTTLDPDAETVRFWAEDVEDVDAAATLLIANRLDLIKALDMEEDIFRHLDGALLINRDGMCDDALFNTQMVPLRVAASRISELINEMQRLRLLSQQGAYSWQNSLIRGLKRSDEQLFLGERIARLIEGDTPMARTRGDIALSSFSVLKYLGTGYLSSSMYFGSFTTMRGVLGFSNRSIIIGELLVIIDSSERLSNMIEIAPFADEAKVWLENTEYFRLAALRLSAYRGALIQRIEDLEQHHEAQCICAE